MKKFELSIGLIAILAIVLKILNIPGGSLLTVLAFLTLSIFYYLSFALFNGIRLREIFKSAAYKDTNAKRIIGAVGLGFALSAILMGALFKLEFWPGGTIQLKIGLVITGVILVIATIFYNRNKIEYYRRIFKRIAIIGGLGLILYLTPTTTLVDIYYRNNPDYADLFKRVLADPDNQELSEELEDKREEMYEQNFRDE
ncbi:MAG: hypothetical protein WD048_00875 [Chitinophagales bacterium]